MFGMIPFRRNNNAVSNGGDYFDQFFNNFFDDDFMMPGYMNGNPFKVDLKESNDAYIIEADLPGVEKGNIDISYDNNYLTISAKRDDTVEENKNNYVRRERRCGELRRSFYVDNVEEDKIDASFENGVLKINLPKKEIVNTNSRKIHIR